MFSLEKYCVEERPNDGILVITFRMPIPNMTTDIQYPMVPDMDATQGALIIKDSSGQVIYKFMNIVLNSKDLIHFFHLAMLYDGLFLFRVSISISMDIEVYLRQELFTTPVFIPATNSNQGFRYPNLAPVLARNEKIKRNYNKPFQIDLYEYQKNNISWMSSIEELSDTNCNDIRYPQLREMNIRRGQCGGKSVLYNSSNGHWYPASFEDTLPIYIRPLWGGLLCDEVGLGKTFSMYGLILNTLGRKVEFWDRKPTKKLLLAEKKALKQIPGPPRQSGEGLVTKYSSTATLITCPSRLAGQWLSELEKFMRPLHDLRVYMITSITQYRNLTVAELCNADIVIVSDRFLINTNYCNWAKDPCYTNRFTLRDFYWKRHIIDEGHEIFVYDNYTNSVPIRNAILEIQSKYRWICTGTPFPYDYKNLDYYLVFLSCFHYKLGDWEYMDTPTIESFLQRCTRRNTYEIIKQEVQIPPVAEVTVLLHQDPVERALYVNATGQTTRMIQLCTNIMISSVDSSILNDKVTSLATIRQRMSDHYQEEINSCHRQIQMAENERLDAATLYDNPPVVYPKDSPEWKEYRKTQKANIKRWKSKITEYHESIKSMQTRKKLFDNFEERVKQDPCAVCYDEITDVVLTKCSHIFCRDCMSKVIEDNPRRILCPLCRTLLNRATDIGYILNKKDQINKNSTYYKHVQKWGTKMAWLIQYLDFVLSKKKNRVIIFSQWERMLRLVGEVLNKVSVKHVYLKGSANQLTKSINKFKTSEDIRVIMLSSETCSSGSNLTEASHIILLDTVNGTAHQAKAIEDQAIGRAARLGQDKSVKVVRLIMKDTLEHDYYKTNIDQTDITEIEGGEGTVKI